MVKLEVTGIFELFFSVLEHKMWVLNEAVAMRAHNLCFSKDKKNVKACQLKIVIL